MAKLHGWAGKVYIASTDYEIKKWSGKLSAEKTDITSTSSAGWKEYLPGGLQGFSGEVEFDYDTAISDGGSLPGPFTNTAVAFKLDIGNSGYCLTFTGIVFDFDISDEVRGGSAVSVKCSFEATGVVTFGAGS